VSVSVSVSVSVITSYVCGGRECLCVCDVCVVCV